MTSLPNSPETDRARVFLLVWFGQMISLVGSGLTSFSLGFWVYRRSGSTGQFALVILAYSLPGIIIGPLAGALVDRWDRRKIMLLSSWGAALCTLAMSGLLWLGNVNAWEIGFAVAGISICEAFQDPAYTASNTLLLQKDKFARGSGLMQLAQAIGLIASPLLAILLLGVIHIQAIMAIDFMTYLFLIVILLGVQIPSPQVSLAGRISRGSLYFEAISGWRYVRDRTGMPLLLAFFSIVVFAGRMVQVVIVPLVLGIGSTRSLATVSSVASFGMVVGSVAMTAWGGPRRRIYSVLASGVVAGLALMVAGLAPSPAFVASALFIFGIAMPFGSASDQIIWQLKTQPDIQGRVFAFRRMVLAICLPLACIVAGLLIDSVFKPLLESHGMLAETLGHLSGVGPARGAGLFLACVGALTLALTGIFSLLPSLRLIEDRLPDTVPLQAATSLSLIAVTDSITELQNQSLYPAKETIMDQENVTDSTVYKVVINHEEQYSIWPASKTNPLGWVDAGKNGLKADCLAYIKEVWTDMTPLSVRKSLARPTIGA